MPLFQGSAGHVAASPGATESGSFTTKPQLNPFTLVRAPGAVPRASQNGASRDFSRFDKAKYMVPAASTWLPMTFVKVVMVLTAVLVFAVAALNTVGDWAHNSLETMSITGCASGNYTAFDADECVGVDFAVGAAVEYMFEELSPYMRWLRVSLRVYVADAQAVSGNATLTFDVSIAGRDPGGPWEEVIRAPTRKIVLCPHRAHRHGTVCDVFNVAFHSGLAKHEYRVQLKLADETLSTGMGWARAFELEAERGRFWLGMIDVALRAAGTVMSLVAIGGFLRSMWQFPRYLWLPQQRMIAAYLVMLLLYNDPSYALLIVMGTQDLFFPTVFATLFVAGGVVLALVLLDMRRVLGPGEEWDGRELELAPQPTDRGSLPRPGCACHSSVSASGASSERSKRDSGEGDPHIDSLDPTADDSLVAFGRRTVSRVEFWIPKVVLGSMLFIVGVVLDGLMYARMHRDPGATYSSSPSWRPLYLVEALVALLAACYAVRLCLIGLRLASDEYHRLKRDAEAGVLNFSQAHMSMSKAYLATATAFVFAIVGIHLREVVRTRVADHPTYSDSAFRTALQNVVVANVLGIGLAYCFKPSDSSVLIREAGGLRAALENGLGGLGKLTTALSTYSSQLSKTMGKALTRGGRAAMVPVCAQAPTNASDRGTLVGTGSSESDKPEDGAPSLDRAAAAVLKEELKTARSVTDGHVLLVKFLALYANKMRSAWASGGDDRVPDTDLDELRELQGALEALPQTARHVHHIKWKYPVLFTQRQRHLWAIFVKEVDSPAGRDFWCRKHPELRGSLSDPVSVPRDDPSALSGLSGTACVASLLAHLDALGIEYETRTIQSASSAPYVVVLLVCSEAVRCEHLRFHHYRCSLELELPVRAPTPMTTADKLTAISRLLTEHPMPGQSHLGLQPGALSMRAAGVELVEGSFPLHDRSLNKVFHQELRRLFVLNDEQLTVLRNHYGEEIAFYYALLNFTCTWLSPMAGLGLLFYLLQYSDAQVLYDNFYVWFASMTVIWGALVYVYWRRRANELALLWDVSSLHEVETINPKFKGNVVKDETHGGLRPHIPYWSRLPAFVHTAFQMFVQGAVLVVLEYVVYSHWVFLNETYDRPEANKYVYYLHSYVLNSLLYIVLIMYGQYVLWSIVAYWCTGKENWEYMRHFNRNYIAYVFIFIWVDGYMWSLIIGFVHIPLVETFTGDLTQVRFPLWGQLFRSNDHDADYWMSKHDTTIIAMLSTNQIAGLCAENVAPVILVYFLHRQLRRQRRLEAQARERSRAQGDVAELGAAVSATKDPLRDIVQQAVEEWWLLEYSTQDDYYDVTLFIGYIATYTVIWAVTPLMCWVNNHIELRTDLIKINRAWRRAVPRRQEGIGSWQPAIGISVGLSIVLVVGFATVSTRHSEVFFRFSEHPAHPAHDEYWNDETGHVYMAYRFVVLFVWEHVLAAILFLIYFFVPPMTSRLRDVKHLKAKLRTIEIERQAETKDSCTNRVLTDEATDGHHKDPGNEAAAAAPRTIDAKDAGLFVLPGVGGQITRAVRVPYNLYAEAVRRTMDMRVSQVRSSRLKAD